MMSNIDRIKQLEMENEYLMEKIGEIRRWIVTTTNINTQETKVILDTFMKISTRIEYLADEIDKIKNWVDFTEGANTRTVH